MTDVTNRRFDIALSFPGEHRRFVKSVADHLVKVLGEGRVFYDEWFEAELLGMDGDLKLARYYREQSEMVVPFFSEHYQKPWCKIEWRATRAMLLNRRNEDAVIPVQMDLTTIPGWEVIDFAIRRQHRGRNRNAKEIADLIIEAYKIRFPASGAKPVGSRIHETSNSSTTPTTSPKSAQSIPADISRIARYAPAELIGRGAETALLNDAWAKVQSHAQSRPRVLTFVALGGEGKTSLVADWVATLAAQDWPGCEAAFAWSFYSQGTREQNAASSDLFLAEALRFFGDEETAAGAQGAFEKGKRLAQLVGRRRSLLILDGLEPLQYAPTSPMPGELKDQGIAALLKGLATTNNGLCVVTTRYAVPDLRGFLNKTAHEEKLTRLSTAAGVALLQSLGVKGSLRKTIPADNPRWNEFEKLVEDVKGHALTLNLLGSYLRDAHNGDIRQSDRIKLAEANAEVQGGHAFHVMDAYVRWLEGEGSESSLQAADGKNPAETGTQNSRRALALLQLLGLFDRPATAACLEVLWQAPAIVGLTEPLFDVETKWFGLKQVFHPISETQRNLSLKRLEDARLLTVNRDAAGTLLSIDAHPLLREYFAAHVRSSAFRRQPLGTSGRAASQPQPPEGGTTNATTSGAWREAHRRLYEHLCETTKEGDQPTLDDLQPLYQAVAHGCLAGLQQEACAKVYRDRILRGTGNGGNYSTFKLGAFGSNLGAVACFFDSLWSRVSPALTESDQAWLLNEAAFHLRALGRLTESLEPMRAGIEGAVKLEDWKNAAIYTCNLSELELTLGLVDAAVRDAEQSVDYADRSGDAFMRMLNRTTHADALHQFGRRAEAESLFQSAEQLQADDQPEYPLLYSLPGFRYCDLLLAEAERSSADCGLRIADSSIADCGLRIADLLDVCRVVTERATQIFKWRKLPKWNPAADSLLDIALDHLTLGRAALYRAILEESAIRNPQSAIAHSHIEHSVTGLRRAGTQDHLPRGLLTRAWLRALTGALTGQDSAQEDLNEAWDIAERGSMKLFMADIHLHRARLFGLRNVDFGLRIEEPYPWISPEHDLAEAERLINECGYHRRDAELAAAKRAILGI